MTTTYKVIARVKRNDSAAYTEKNFGFFDDFATAEKFAADKVESLIENINITNGKIVSRYRQHVYISDVQPGMLRAAYYVNTTDLDGAPTGNIAHFIIHEIS